MGDFYIGQPTMEGTVKEVPGWGIMNMIPGISTFTNFIGRNRGLPEGSDAFKKAMADSKKPSFQPITDIIDSFTRGVGGLKNIFDTEETDTNPMICQKLNYTRKIRLRRQTTCRCYGTKYFWFNATKCRYSYNGT